MPSDLPNSLPTDWTSEVAEIESTVRVDHGGRGGLDVDDNRDSVDDEDAPHIEGVGTVLGVDVDGVECIVHNMDSEGVRVLQTTDRDSSGLVPDGIRTVEW